MRPFYNLGFFFKAARLFQNSNSHFACVRLSCYCHSSKDETRVWFYSHYHIANMTSYTYVTMCSLKPWPLGFHTLAYSIKLILHTHYRRAGDFSYLPV